MTGPDGESRASTVNDVAAPPPPGDQDIDTTRDALTVAGFIVGAPGGCGPATLTVTVFEGGLSPPALLAMSLT
jgi:hypothetical protein